MKLPKYVVLKSMYNNKYLRYRDEGGEQQGFLQFSGDDAASPYSKFEVKVSSSRSGLIHLKCCVNKKYWVRSSPSQWWIRGAADRPEEDQSKWSCTLFKPVPIDGDVKTVRFQHVQLNHYACLFRSGPPFGDCLYAGWEAANHDLCDACAVIDWDSLSTRIQKRVSSMSQNRTTLPKFVVLKSSYNSKYLRYRHEGGEQHGFLQYSEDKATSQYAKFEVKMAKSGDGLVHLKCCYNNKYLVRWSPKHWWIRGAADRPEEDRSKWSCTLFNPVYVNGDPATVRFLHVQLGHYACLFRSGPPFGDCLYAGWEDPNQDLCDVCMIIDWDSLAQSYKDEQYEDGDLTDQSVEDEEVEVPQPSRVNVRQGGSSKASHGSGAPSLKKYFRDEGEDENDGDQFANEGTSRTQPSRKTTQKFRSGEQGGEVIGGQEEADKTRPSRMSGQQSRPSNVTRSINVPGKGYNRDQDDDDGESSEDEEIKKTLPSWKKNQFGGVCRGSNNTGRQYGREDNEDDGPWYDEKIAGTRPSHRNDQQPIYGNPLDEKYGRDEDEDKTIPKPTRPPKGQATSSKHVLYEDEEDDVGSADGESTMTHRRGGNIQQPKYGNPRRGSNAPNSYGPDADEYYIGGYRSAEESTMTQPQWGNIQQPKFGNVRRDSNAPSKYGQDEEENYNVRYQSAGERSTTSRRIRGTTQQPGFSNNRRYGNDGISNDLSSFYNNLADHKREVPKEESDQVEFTVVSSANDFWGAIFASTDILPKALPDLYTAITVVSGDGFSEGSVREITFARGKQTPWQKSEEQIVYADHEKKTVTWSVIQGGMLNYYDTFKVTVAVTPKKRPKRRGSTVNWSYHGTNPRGFDREALKRFVKMSFDDLDAYLEKMPDMETR
ncbi:unnamed protein product [Linum tenue]|nr:unnamed protein product [Linum tenue]